LPLFVFKFTTPAASFTSVEIRQFAFVLSLIYRLGILEYVEEKGMLSLIPSAVATGISGNNHIEGGQNLSIKYMDGIFMPCCSSTTTQWLFSTILEMICVVRPENPCMKTFIVSLVGISVMIISRSHSYYTKCTTVFSLH
jgi:hypothetical protein